MLNETSKYHITLADAEGDIGTFDLRAANEHEAVSLAIYFVVEKKLTEIPESGIAVSAAGCGRTATKHVTPAIARQHHLAHARG